MLIMQGSGSVIRTAKAATTYQGQDWFALSNRGKTLTAVARAYFNRISISCLASRVTTAGVYTLPTTGGAAGNSPAGTTTLFHHLLTCRWMKFSINNLDSLADVCDADPIMCVCVTCVTCVLRRFMR